MTVCFVVYRGEGKQYLNVRGTWTNKKENAKLFDTEAWAWAAAENFSFGCGVERREIS